MTILTAAHRRASALAANIAPLGAHCLAIIARRAVEFRQGVRRRGANIASYDSTGGDAALRAISRRVSTRGAPLARGRRGARSSPRHGRNQYAPSHRHMWDLAFILMRPRRRPVKTELPQGHLLRSSIFVEYPADTHEGEIQQLPGEHKVTELWQVIGRARRPPYDREITLSTRRLCHGIFSGLRFRDQPTHGLFRNWTARRSRRSSRSVGNILRADAI